MIIVTTGGRDYTDFETVETTLDDLYVSVGGDLRVRVGDATGADALVRAWCIRRLVEWRLFEADWAHYGAAAGPIRNKQMLEWLPPPQLLVAFPGGPGTISCKREAAKRNIAILDVSAEELEQLFEEP